LLTELRRMAAISGPGSYGTRLPRGSSGALQFLSWWAAAPYDRLIPSRTSPLLSSALAILPGRMSVQLWAVPTASGAAWVRRRTARLRHPDPASHPRPADPPLGLAKCPERTRSLPAMKETIRAGLPAFLDSGLEGMLARALADVATNAIRGHAVCRPVGRDRRRAPRFASSSASSVVRPVDSIHIANSETFAEDKSRGSGSHSQSATHRPGYAAAVCSSVSGSTRTLVPGCG